MNIESLVKKAHKEIDVYIATQLETPMNQDTLQPIEWVSIAKKKECQIITLFLEGWAKCLSIAHGPLDMAATN